MSKIAGLWADKVVSGDRAYTDVPAQLKDEVTEILEKNGHANLTKVKKTLKKS